MRLPGLMARMAPPALLLGLALLFLRLAGWPLWSHVPPTLRIALACVIVAALLVALIGAGFAHRESRHRNLIAWVSVLASFAIIPVADRDYDDWWWANHDIEIVAIAPLQLPTVLARRATALREGAIILNRQQDGHYYVNVMIDGSEVGFLVDTGASGIMLTPYDAERIGLRMDRLDFTVPVSTASGQTFAAPVDLRRLDLHGQYFEEFPALVLQGGDVSLLGMSILEQFSSIEIREDQLILRP